MKLNLFPPAIIRTTETLPVYGRAKAFFVQINPDAPSSTLPHELCHAWQWWSVTLLTALMGYLLNQQLLYILAPSLELLLSFIPHYRLLRECMAHAVSAKHYQDPNDYIERHAVHIVSDKSSYTELHRFNAKTAQRLMSWFYRLLL